MANGRYYNLNLLHSVRNGFFIASNQLHFSAAVRFNESHDVSRIFSNLPPMNKTSRPSSNFQCGLGNCSSIAQGVPASGPLILIRFALRGAPYGCFTMCIFDEIAIAQTAVHTQANNHLKKSNYQKDLAITSLVHVLQQLCLLAGWNDLWSIAAGWDRGKSKPGSVSCR